MDLQNPSYSGVHLSTGKTRNQASRCSSRSHSRLQSDIEMREVNNKNFDVSVKADVRHVSIFRRLIHGWTFQVYATALGTGAIYLVLYNLPWKHKALTYIQIVFFILNITIFVITTLILLLQLFLYPSRSRSVILDPSTTIFVPIMALDSASIIMGLINYAVPNNLMTWQTVEILFFTYIVLSLTICIPLTINWYNKPHDMKTFTPAWAFLVFPLMLVGVVASRVLSVMPLETPNTVSVMFLGYMFQGLGTCMTFFYLPIYLARIMETGFMEGHQANGAFVAAGPPGFTAVALISLGRLAPEIFKANDLHDSLTEQVGTVFFGMGVFLALFLLGLCALLFLMAVIPYYNKIHKRLDESLGLWATTFPCTGMTITLRLLGDIFQSGALHSVQFAMTIFVCCAYVVAMSCTLTALFQGKILLSPSAKVLQEGRRSHIDEFLEVVQDNQVSHRLPRISDASKSEC